MIRRGAVEHGPGLRGAAEQVVHERGALGHIVEAVERPEHVVVDQARAGRDLDHKVTPVVVVDVARDARALHFPVQPGAKRAVVDVVVANYGVDGGVEFDATDFMAEELVLGGNVVDVVVFDQ